VLSRIGKQGATGDILVARDTPKCVSGGPTSVAAFAIDNY